MNRINTMAKDPCKTIYPAMKKINKNNNSQNPYKQSSLKLDRIK